jgi:hypothetical protein
MRLVGYCEVPQKGTIADVATILDCSTSTARELAPEAVVIRMFAETT